MTPEALLQTTMARWLGRRRDLGKDDEARRFAAEHIAGNARLSPVEQLEIYREQYWLRHTSSLVEDFPGLGGILGQTDWERLVEEYLVAHPPDSFSLRDLGAALPAFVASSTWLPRPALVRDMARLEWAHVEVFDAPEAGPLAPDKLSAVPEDAWEGIRLVPHPALRLLAVDYPVVELWRRLVAAQRAGESDPILLPEPSPEKLAVRRRNLEIVHERLEPDAYALLSKLCEGMTLGAACESVATELAPTPETLGARLETWFANWTANGYLVDIMV